MTDHDDDDNDDDNEDDDASFFDIRVGPWTRNFETISGQEEPRESNNNKAAWFDLSDKGSFLLVLLIFSLTYQVMPIFYRRS